MPGLFLKMDSLIREGRLEETRAIQHEVNAIIEELCSCRGNMYAVIKAILRAQGGPDIGGVRAPLYELQPEDRPTVAALADEIAALVHKYCG